MKYLKGALLSALNGRELEINHFITTNNLKNKENSVNYFITESTKKQIYDIMHISVLAGPKNGWILIQNNLEFKDLINLEEALLCENNSFLKLAEENLKKENKELALKLISYADSYIIKNKLLSNGGLCNLYLKEKNRIFNSH